MVSNDYLICLDSGGTKTLAVAYDDCGKKLATIKTGFGNPVVSYNETLAHLSEAIQQIMERVPNNLSCYKIIIGLAGLDSSGCEEQLLADLQKQSFGQIPIVLMNDAKLSHYAILKGEDGLLLISGTGSVLIGKFNQEWARVGGWGHLFGDEGSGFYIGSLLIKYVLRLIDTKRLPNKVSDDVFSYLEVSTTKEFVKKIMAFNKIDVASLGELVVKNAQQSPIYDEILVKAGQALAEQIKLYITTYPTVTRANLLIGLNGGVIENSSVMQQVITDELKQANVQFEFINKTTDSTIGGWYYERGKKHG